MTGSRSAFFGLAVICIVLFPTWHRRDRLRACLAGLAAPALAWLVKPSLVSNFTALFGQLGADRSSLSRADAYSEAVPYIAAHPWLGQGFQTFFPQTYFFVDNQYVTSLLETGVLGLLALVVCFATGWFTARSARPACSSCCSAAWGRHGGWGARSSWPGTRPSPADYERLTSPGPTRLPVAPDA